MTRDAGKPAWPTKCFTALGDSVKNDKSQEQSRDTKDARHYSSGANMKFDCAAASDHVQRLCPCVREATLVEKSSQVDSSTDPDEVHADQE